MTTTTGTIARRATGAAGPGPLPRRPRGAIGTAAMAIATAAGGASTDTRRRETGDTATEAATEVGCFIVSILPSSFPILSSFELGNIG